MLCQFVIADTPFIPPPPNSQHGATFLWLSWPWPPALIHNKVILYCCEYCVLARVLTMFKAMFLQKDSDKKSLAYTFRTGIRNRTSREFKVPFQKPLLSYTFGRQATHIQVIHLISSHIGNEIYDLAVDSMLLFELQECWAFGKLCI